MFGFSSYSCYDCFYLDRDSVKHNTGWCNEKRKWMDLSGPACNKFEELFYVITAWCDINDFPKENEYIIKLMNFRDNFMRNNETGNKFLNEYTFIGPVIACKLLSDSNRYEISEELDDNYIKPMLSFISEKDYDLAQNTFIDMIEELKIRYNCKTLTKKEKTLIKF